MIDGWMVGGGEKRERERKKASLEIDLLCYVCCVSRKKKQRMEWKKN